MEKMTIRQVINEVEYLDCKINEWFGKLRNSVTTEDRNICREYISMYQQQKDTLDKILDREIIVEHN